MEHLKLNNKQIKSILVYFGTSLLTLLILTWVMKLWHSDLSIPFLYSGDALFSGSTIKTIIDNGWYLNNKFIGMPFGTNFYDYPGADGFSYLLIKLISLFSSNYAIVLNIFFLISFPLTAITSLYVFHKFKISYALSVLGGLLFAFIPYHFLRGEGHLFLSSYYSIPLIIMVIFWVFKEDKFLFIDNIKSINSQLILSIIICLLISSSGIYYAFFACFFLLIAGMYTTVNRFKLYPLLTSAILILVISMGVIINILPSVIYNHEHGKNTVAVIRGQGESELYGLKITQLLLPINGHRINLFAKERAKYNQEDPLNNENGISSLGIIGSVGFLIILANFIFGKHKESSEINYLSILNITAILLATIGGFSSLFAILISPMIRGYNRISIFIAFFSIFALMIIFNEVFKKFIKKRIVTISLVMIILIVGIYDQTNNTYIPNYSYIKAEYNSDDNFVHQIESQTPRNSMIFQLPYYPFPESPAINKINPYELFKGYLHSKTLKWSYGAMKGREGDSWYKTTSQQPVEDMLKTISLSGFNGIYIDRFGYKDQANALIDDLSHRLNEKPLISDDKRLAFFKFKN